MIQNLSTKIDDGFIGVHDRQDRTNGNVIKNSEFRIATTSTISTLKYLVGVFGTSNIVLLFKIFS